MRDWDRLGISSVRRTVLTEPLREWPRRASDPRRDVGASSGSSLSLSLSSLPSSLGTHTGGGALPPRGVDGETGGRDGDRVRDGCSLGDRGRDGGWYENCRSGRGREGGVLTSDDADDDVEVEITDAFRDSWAALISKIQKNI